MQSAKKVVASAQAGMEKTKAVVQEKVEKMKTKDPIQKDMATEKKEAKINEAEMLKQQAYSQNAAGKHTTSAAAPGATAGSYTNSTTSHPVEADTGLHGTTAHAAHGTHPGHHTTGY